ncbi:MBL fold metallo-hydrolase [Anaeroselena agilis]|uniref:MBL fold metallo-hydrolase n=1 Tax=Anaeroselena agilis TaxID=3063788 RepID=A0ABU3NZ42_9FIRM|nr:MBL fold metallo-hydrolase [Selenomonadales bacterium 4137-cl]
MTGIEILLPGFPAKADRGFFGWCNVVALKTGDGWLIVDTGSHGDRAVLLQAMAARGIDPLAVKKVFLTHLHFDHCLNADLFANAALILGRKEWAYANSSLPEERGDTFVPKPYLGYLAGRRLNFVGEGDTLAPGLRVLELPGHTPGCLGLLREADGTLIAGDALKNPREYHHRDPALCFDSRDNALASLERIAGLARRILPGHDSAFSLEDGEITGRSAPRVSITHYIDWRRRDGAVQSLPGEGE